MGPATHQRAAHNAAGARDPLHPPPFNGTGNPLQWAYRVLNWVDAHERLCKEGNKNGLPAYIRGYLLMEALRGTAYQTVVGTNPRDVINSNDGVKAILKLLVKFNPTTYAHKVFTSFKTLMQIRRRPTESFQLYVNRFEAAASQLRSLTSQTTEGEAVQFVAFQLLEGAQVPTAVFMQVLTNCVGTTPVKNEKDPLEEAVDALEQLATKLSAEPSQEFKAKLAGLAAEAATPIQNAHTAELKEVADKATALKVLLEENKVPLVAEELEGFDRVTVDFESAKAALLGLDAVSLERPAALRAQYGPTTERGTIEQTVRQTLLTQKAVPKASQQKKQQRSGKSKPTTPAQRIAERKAKTNCKECGLKGHWAGDPECKGSSQSQAEQTNLYATQDGEQPQGVASPDSAGSFFQ